MDEKVLEFLEKVSSKISEIDDMAKDYGFEKDYVSCVSIGVVTNDDEQGALLNSVYSLSIDSDEEMERMLLMLEETYNKLKSKSDKKGRMGSMFDDINLN